MQAQETLKKMRETMIMQRYSRATIKTYLHWVRLYCKHLLSCEPAATREERII